MHRISILTSATSLVDSVNGMMTKQMRQIRDAQDVMIVAMDVTVFRSLKEEPIKIAMHVPVVTTIKLMLSLTYVHHAIHHVLSAVVD